MVTIFHDFDVTDFWEDSAYARRDYVEDAPSDELIASIEAELRVHLPASYLELMRVQNGGIPRNRCFPLQNPRDYVPISGICGVGRTKIHSLCGRLGSRFMQDDWGYPPIGVHICTTPSAGHDMVMLDYRQCGAQGEPEVVHVDVDGGESEISFLARDFETFIRALVNEGVYAPTEEELQQELRRQLRKVKKGSFSTVLAALIAGYDEPSMGRILRKVCGKLTVKHGHFTLRSDELSHLLFDILFELYSHSRRVGDADAYLKIFPDMLVFGNGKFRTGGYAPKFVEDWINARLSRGEIVARPGSALAFSELYRHELKRKLDRFR